MNNKTFICTLILLIGFSACVLASPKEMTGSPKGEYDKSDVVDECVGLPHGELVGCIMEKMRREEALSQPQPYSKQLKRVQLKGMPGELSKEENPIPASKDSIAQGKVFYKQNCISCHGATGKGDGPILKELKITGPDLTTPYLQSIKDSDFLGKISEGGWPMPAFGYQAEWSKEDLWNVINYIRTLSTE